MKNRKSSGFVYLFVSLVHLENSIVHFSAFLLNFDLGIIFNYSFIIYSFILDRRSNLQVPFLRLTKYCTSVLCCRSTPLQKAYLVRVVKEKLNMRTLAIGKCILSR